MKTFTLSLLATFCTLFTFAQNLSEPATAPTPQTQSVHSSDMFLNSNRAQTASILEQSKANTEYYMNAFRESKGDRCEHAKKMRTVGIVLASVGGGLLVGGVALIAVGVTVETNDLNNGGDGLSGIGMIGGGVVCTILGLAGTGAGIPIAIISSVKAKKYCGGGKERSYMQLSTKGNGLALSF